MNHALANVILLKSDQQPYSDALVRGIEQPVHQKYTRERPPLDKDSESASCYSPRETERLSEQPEATRRKNLSYWCSWAWEIVNCVVLVVSLFGILATLYPHHGQPLPRWPFSISINTLLSIYGLIMKASMLLILSSGISQLQWIWFLEARPLQDVVRYHDAAQGPLRSLTWLWRRPARQTCQFLTSMAAVIVIMAVAVDPFVQQLFRPVDCKRIEEGSDPASITRTGYLSYLGSTPDAAPYLYPGYYSSNNSPNLIPQFSCGTGNCTFDTEYSSLAYCSVCKDVSDSLRFDERCVLRRNGTSWLGSCDGDLPQDTQIVKVNWTTTLASVSPPVSVNFNYEADPGGSNRSEKYTAFKVAGIPGTAATASRGASHEIDFGYDLGIVLAKRSKQKTADELASCYNKTGGNIWSCQLYGAAQCSLAPCIRTYTANVNGGVLTETEVERVSWAYRAAYIGLNDTPEAVPERSVGLLDTYCIDEIEKDALAASGYPVEGNTRWLPYNISLTTAEAALTKSLLARGCLYGLDGELDYFLGREVLEEFITGSVEIDVTRLRSNGTETFALGPDQVVQLYNLSNVDFPSVNAAMSRIADSITMWIRANGETPYSQAAIGLEYHYAICVHVSWAWAALPGALTILTVVFFLLTAIEVRSKNVPMWKGSPLALLFHGPAGLDWVDPTLLAKPSANKKPDLMTDRGMQEFADTITVRAVREEDEDGGWLRLQQVAPAPARKSRGWGLRRRKQEKQEVDNDDLEQLSETSTMNSPG
ncbi:hypothetical protein F4780DRAFT_521255 [Xylariomycetidae sp. FL0641]|nr:hypothetical protein F4780DRAFT_521255 [Xylariomycetidae sp. FL0641]